jgi:hypothetical protein
MEGVGVIQYMILLVATYTCAASGGWHSRHFEEHSASFVWCILRIYLTPPLKTTHSHLTPLSRSLTVGALLQKAPLLLRFSFPFFLSSLRLQHSLPLSLRVWDSSETPSLHTYL